LEEDTGNKDVDLLAITSLFNLTHNKDLNVGKQITKYLIDKLEKYSETNEIKNTAYEILNNKRIGLLLNERAVNLPMQLVPHLLKLLVEDISDYKSDNINDNKFDVDYMIIISK
jgi:protein BCP1